MISVINGKLIRDFKKQSPGKAVILTAQIAASDLKYEVIIQVEGNEKQFERFPAFIAVRMTAFLLKN